MINPANTEHTIANTASLGRIHFAIVTKSRIPLLRYALFVIKSRPLCVGLAARAYRSAMRGTSMIFLVRIAFMISETG